MTFKSERNISLPLVIIHQKCLFAYDSINGTLLTPFSDNRIALVHTTGNTRVKRLNQLVNFKTGRALQGTISIKARAVQAWNHVNNDYDYSKLQDLNKSE